MFFLIALLLGLLGASVVFFARDTETGEKGVAFIILTVIYTLFGWWIIWGMLPSIAWPLFGGYFGLVMIWWAISGIVASIMSDDWHHGWWFPIVGIVVLLGILIGNAKAFNSEKYASLIGNIQDKNQKNWSQDIQPLDPTHIRLVPEVLAISLAKTALSDNGMAIGSRFPLSEENITL
jgi:hypothetical protein